MTESKRLVFFHVLLRMDDIQLCKDIMKLKQELRKIVAVPGDTHTHTYTHTYIHTRTHTEMSTNTHTHTHT